MSIRAQLIGVVLLTLVAAGAAWVAQGWRYDAKISQIQAQHAAVLELQAQAVVKSVEVAREIERQQTAAVESERDNAIKQNDALAADVAAGATVADRLRAELAKLRASRARTVAAAANGSNDKQSDDPIGMLIYMYQGMDSTGREVSGYADRLKIAGLACERSYDAVRASQAKK